MSFYELMDLALSINTRLDTHWSLFITVHLALIGGIIYVDRPLKRNEKVGAILIYTGFALINYFVMSNQIAILNSFYEQVISLKDDACCKDSVVMHRVVKQMEDGYESTMRLFVRGTHIVMYLIVLMSIVYDKPKEKKAG